MGLNQATLRVLNEKGDDLQLAVTSLHCDRCLPYIEDTFNESNKTFYVDSRFSSSLSINSTDANINASIADTHLHEGCVYELHTWPNVHLTLVDDSGRPNNIAIAFIYLSFILFWPIIFGSILVLKRVQHMIRRRNKSEDGDHLVNELSDERDSEGVKVKLSSSSNRLVSLDAFRGMSLTIMIFVNYGGGGYWFFAHSAWNGLTLADLVFPWFVFIMGTSLVFSVKHRLKKVSCFAILLDVLRRSVILFSLGLVINTLSGICHGGGGVSLDKIRIPGVLQRLAIAFLLTACIEIPCAKFDLQIFRRCHDGLIDLSTSFVQLMTAFLLLVLHGLVSTLSQVNAYDEAKELCPRGYLGPGGISDYGQFYNCTGGVARYIDEQVFGVSHMYQRPTSTRLYQTKIAFDPEGLLGCLTTVALCLIGTFAARIFIHSTTTRLRLIKLMVSGVACGIVVAILCGAFTDAYGIPINKNLWSVSFILSTGALAFVLLALFHVLIDVGGWWSGAPFIWPGKNSILIYILHEAFAGVFPVQWSVGDDHAAKSAMHLWGVTFWLLVSAFLFHKRIFLSI